MVENFKDNSELNMDSLDNLVSFIFHVFVWVLINAFFFICNTKKLIYLIYNRTTKQLKFLFGPFEVLEISPRFSKNAQTLVKINLRSISGL